MMLQFAAFLTVLGIGIQVGTIVYFSFVLTPTLFGNLTRDEAGRAVRLCFPGYYSTAAIALGIALMAALIARRPVVLVLLLAVAFAAEVYAGVGLLPKMLRARAEILDPEAPDEADPAAQEWRRLHTRSVQVNVGALALGLTALWLAIR